jgi:hypothetical protein
MTGGVKATAAAAAPDGPRPQLVRIVTPKASAMLTTAEATVVINVARGAVPSSLHIDLDGRSVTRLFARHHHRFHAVLTRRNGLIVGANVVTARVRGRNGGSSIATTVFTMSSAGLGVAAQPLPPTFPLKTRVATASAVEPGDHLAVTVGNVIYHAPAPPAWQCGTGAWVLALDRKSLDETASVDYPLCTPADATALGGALTAFGSGKLVVVNSLTRGDIVPPPLPNLGTDALAKIGAVASDFDGYDLTGSVFSVEGVPGLPSGQAYQVGAPLSSEVGVPAGLPTAASVNGTLVQDNNANYTVVMRDYVLYDIAANGEITLDGHLYPVPAVSDPGVRGGFHVLVVDRRTLTPRSNTFYDTNSDDGTVAVAEQLRMTSDLTDLAGPSVLIFVATVGNPIGPASAPAGDPAHCTSSGGASIFTCSYTTSGARQLSLTIPWGVRNLHVVAVGASGGPAYDGGHGGRGAYVDGSVPVGPGGPLHPNQTIYLVPGGNGGEGSQSDGGTGGANGGAVGGRSTTLGGWAGGGGGGASDLQALPLGSAQALTSRIVVAAGGGGGGGNTLSPFSGFGGNGGVAGSPGQDGRSDQGKGGQPGTATSGGKGGAGPISPGTDGTLGAGGGGGRTYDTGDAGGGGGGGGGGFYGGGGGGGGHTSGGGGGGGGGGSSLVPVGGTQRIDTTGQPLVTVSYTARFGPTIPQALVPFGASPNLIDDLATTPRYALVGAIGSGPSFTAPEASPELDPNWTGELQGVLVPGRQGMWYGPAANNAPVQRTINGQKQPPTILNFGLFQAISPGITGSWPVPRPGDTGQEAAYTALSQATCGCADLRSQYDAPSNNISTWKTALKSATYPTPAPPDYTRADFDAVQAQLVTELTDVYLVDGLKSQSFQVASDANQTLGPALTRAYQQVRSMIPVAGPTPVRSMAAALINDIGIVVSAVPDVGSPLGALAALMSQAVAGTTDPNGALYAQLQTTVDDLAQQAADGYSASLTSLSETFHLIVSDWPKLSFVADGINRHPSDWVVTDIGQYVTAITAATTLGAFERLVPLVYGAFEAQAANTDKVSEWCPKEDLGKHVCIFSPDYTPGVSFMSYPVHDPSHGYAAAYDNIAVGQAPVITTNPELPEWYASPPLGKTLLDTMQADGLNPALLFLRWPLPRQVCPGADWQCIN